MISIKVENLGKQYRLGQVGTGTISHDLNRWWHLALGKEDPYLKIGEANDRSTKGTSDVVWALKDINFEVKQGEVLGIIGKNGAGKSTLLKILSRVTGPTVGDIRVKGRIASLLEVGTGFHPELTGRENIFLNGAVLGMSKREIRSKFDEIVDFSGVERYVDTPVKRYSSGMYVRLAFAVAAHLEPEILVVDEVLAVGDAEFQKKAIGKMQDVSKGEGRTVLFVSHNMTSIRSLCNRVLMLDKGTIHSSGDPLKIISNYLSVNRKDDGADKFIIPEDLSIYNTGQAKFRSISILNSENVPSRKINFKENFKVVLELEVKQRIENVIINLFILNMYGDKIVTFSSGVNFSPSNFEKGLQQFELKNEQSLIPGEYSLCFSASFHNTGSSIDYIENAFPFEILKESKDGTFEYPWVTLNGYVHSENLIELKSK